ncbi:late competence protein [Gracilibacillus halophilus YIM-C55.5]|uniref:Late competence protein n=1 Tax=Gracilibacillus halophilus YIM-C55.5 TaxID=1308866 RepID=N4WWK4_9BACI|nr:competence type IV pilus ATPase ComGA [Gracilibacillus halophilus]ENH97456.1 late competence protein [Gracilibacillus halophilus YIM-C55.5]
MVTTSKQAYQLIYAAIQSNASDIHCCPNPPNVEIFHRIQGRRYFIESIPLSRFQTILSYFKFVANMDIGEEQLAQNGSLTIDFAEKRYALRISTLPVYPNESLAIRILPQSELQTLQDLLLFPQQYNQMMNWLQQRSGLILLTGPTGSGKTTMLYAMLHVLNQNHSLQTISLEDPIEKQLPHMIQVQVNQQSGLTYHEGLKAVLRHDPDVIMVGEIRDQATAHFVFRAALTGHLVLSTLHAKNTKGTIQRLLEMGLSHLDLEQNLISIASLQLLPIQLQKQRQQRAAIIETLEGDPLYQLIQKPYRDVDTLTHDTFNRLRRKAFAYGFTTQAVLSHTTF